MTQINPLAGAIIMGTAVQHRHATEKGRQLRRLQNLSKNTALQGDDLEHQVENSDAVHPVNDQDGSHPQQQPEQQKQADGEPPHIDLKA